MTKHFLTIDFESVTQTSKWFAYALMLVEYPSGKIVQCKEGGCKRVLSEYDVESKIFWNKHKNAHDYLLKKHENVSDDIEIEEFNLCSCIRQIIQDFPNVYIVSDNPQYDIRLLDNMLEKYNFPPISVRGPDIYYQCICTWSFQLATLALLDLKREDINNYLHNNKLLKQRQIDSYFGLRHTPTADCARILNEHFQLMDIVYHKKCL